MKRIELQEHSSATARLSVSDAVRIAAFGSKIGIRPSGEAGEYVLTAGSHVGTIRLEDAILVIRPKVPVANLFWMLSYAHELADFRDLDISLARAEDIFEFIVKIFARKVCDLTSQGLVRGYVEQEDNLKTVRGRVVVLENLRHNGAVKSHVFCRYVEHTEDVMENRILKLCCFLLLREPWRDLETTATLHAALTRFENVRLIAVSDADMDSVFYSRLNERYAGCIALARLLLARLSVQEDYGTVPASAFLIDMNSLFERFVPYILQGYVERLGGQLERQQTVRLTVPEPGLSPIYGRPDMRIRWPDGKVVVLDTKYKEPGTEAWEIEDLYQVAAHCVAAGSPVGVLIYASPTVWEWRRRLVKVGTTIVGFSLPLGRPREEIVERIRVLASLALGLPA